MNATRDIPDVIRTRQNDASNPDISAWVAANAGAGKTHVLAQRVIKLLLRGVDPAKILCITFTKAAAANMALRIFGTLAKWTSLDDAALDAAIKRIGADAGAATRARARRLFALALETPGGLKVQTIHAFCTQLLHQFPFEANVAARFAVLDETTERQLLDRLTLDVLLDAAAVPDGAAGRALATAIAVAADQTFQDVVREAIARRDEIEDWIDRAGSADAAIAELSRLLGVDPADTLEAVETDFFGHTLIPAADWPAIAAVLSEGSENDKDQIKRIAAFAAANGAMRLEAYLDIFCTGERTPRKSLVTRTIAKAHPRLLQRLLDEQQRLCALLQRRHAVVCRERSAALLTIANIVISRYRAEKDRRGLLDYDDLIARTLRLLENTDAAWVHYKLDRGIDHVLIDEGQDTSPQQWEIIRRLVAEFTVGAGAREATRRTIFAVGDEKQAIYSFQGSDPRQFAEMSKYFRKAHAAAGLSFETVQLTHSFRSGPNILRAVEAIYKERAIFAGVTSDEEGIPPHIALPDAAPGVVEIWPLIETADRREIEGWQAPFDEETEASPRVQLARKIARHVRLWLDRRALTGAEPKPLSPRDIIILVRQRGPLFEAIIRALKNAGVAVAGADRLMLTEHIAIMDLIALADSLLLPEDDLALATVLKSPLFGFDDSDLFAIAWNRGPLSLRQSLLRKADNPRFAEAARHIEKLSAIARDKSPFAFYADVLGPGGGRKRILARLGPEAADALDEFLNLALDYESRETPSLQGFIAWLRAARAEVKRDMEIVREEVRVMTVHGAKGLEAPIVVLADTTTPPAGRHPPRLLALPAASAPPQAPDLMVWAAAKATDPPPIAAARDAAMKAAADEYRRLLYVAMTRAADRLIVCGTAGRRKKDGTLPLPEGCWYSLTEQALRDDAIEVDGDDGEGKVWRYVKAAPDLPAAASAKTTPAEPAEKTMPGWLQRDVAPHPERAKTITPSASVAEPPRAVAARAEFARENAIARGRLVHRLLQSLPDIPRERRAQTARAYLAHAGVDLSEADREQITAQALRVLEDARFAPLFAPGSRAEVPIVGRIAQDGRPPLVVSGQVDRLAVTDETILIADYKTNRPAPKNLHELGDDHEYVRQLAAYRAVLQKIYPDRTVRAALVWTDIPDLMEIPAEKLDRAWQTLTSS
jgi:ATP-dependent helicase/nuclease subunit A